MKLSELIAHGERLIGTVRDFHEGVKGVGDATDGGMAPEHVQAVTGLGRRNAELQRDVKVVVSKNKELRGRVIELQEQVGTQARRKLALEGDNAMLLKQLGERPTRDVVKLHEKIHDLERQVRAHRETIQGYFQQLSVEARKGNPNGKAAPANTDG